MIPLKKAALLYCTDERNILNWAKQHKITVSRIGATWMIDENSLNRVIELQTKISHYDEYLAEMLRIKEKELSNVILQVDDLIFFFKSINRISPIFRAIINEMASLIPDEVKRNIFLDVMKLKKLSDVAAKHNLPVDKTCKLYESAIRCVQCKAGFLKNLRNEIIGTRFMLRRQEIVIRNQRERIDHLSDILAENLPNPKMFGMWNSLYIPLECVKMLSLNLITDVRLDVRIKNCLQCLDLYTVEDLLRYIKGEGLEKLLRQREFGQKSLGLLRDVLVKDGILDSKGDSHLYQYL